MVRPWLTPSERATLWAVYELQVAGVRPVVRDLLAPTGRLSTSSVQAVIESLCAKGLIVRVPRRARTLRLAPGVVFHGSDVYLAEPAES